jgi:hypothetical protein
VPPMQDRGRPAFAEDVSQRMLAVPGEACGRTADRKRADADHSFSRWHVASESRQVHGIGRTQEGTTEGAAEVCSGKSEGSDRMKVAISARFGRKEECRRLASAIRRHEHLVVSHWLSSTEDDESLDAMEKGEAAIVDIAAVRSCDVLVCLSEKYPWDTSGATRGGRHVELGAALALWKQVILVGPPENIFYHHEYVRRAKNKKHVIEILKELEDSR